MEALHMADIEIIEWMDRIQKTIECFTNNEKHLLEIQVSERCLVHKFAIALNALFDSYDIDVEYNRAGTDEKLLHWQIKDLSHIKEFRTLREKGDEYYTLVTPDIIIHKRKTDENKIAFEIKRKSNRDQNEKKFDRMKLRAYTNAGSHSLKYVLGVYIEFDDTETTTNHQVEYYQNGDIVSL